MTSGLNYITTLIMQIEFMIYRMVMEKEMQVEKCGDGDKCYFCDCKLNDYEDKFIFKDKVLCLCDYCLSTIRELEGWW